MEHRALEVKTCWGDSVLDACAVAGTDPKTIEGVSVLPDPLDAGTFAIDMPERFTGTIQKKGSRVALSRSMLPYTVGDRETIELSNGRITLRMRYVASAAFSRPGIFDGVSYRWVNAWLIAFFVHSTMIVAFTSRPETTGELYDELRKFSSQVIVAKLVPRRQPFAPVTAVTAKQVEAGGGEPAPKRSPVVFRRRGRDDGVVDAKHALARLFNEGTRHVFDTGALGEGLQNALGDVRGRDVQANLVSFRTNDTWPGGSGLGDRRSVGPGALTGIGAVDPGFGEGRVRLEKSSRELIISQSEPAHVEGSLAKDVIQGVIHSHVAQIRYCYERELQRIPGLWGKLAIEFVIGADGSVTSAKIAHSTMSYEPLESCVLGRIRGWKFPEPRGGGEVLVKYPFIFRPAG